jgi:predicted ATPase
MAAALGFSSHSAQINYYSADMAIKDAKQALFEIAPEIKIEIQNCKNVQRKAQKEIQLGFFMGRLVTTAIESVRKLPEEDFQQQIPRLQELAQEMFTSFRMDSYIKTVAALVKSGPTVPPPTDLDDSLVFS